MTAGPGAVAKRTRCATAFSGSSTSGALSNVGRVSAMLASGAGTMCWPASESGKDKASSVQQSASAAKEETPRRDSGAESDADTVVLTKNELTIEELSTDEEHEECC